MINKIDRQILFKFIRYSIVGITTNAALYIFYLLLTGPINLTPLLSTSTTYLTGVILSYIGNALWTFGAGRLYWEHSIRYVVTYLAGYCAQASTLMLILFITSIPHQIAQLFAMAAALMIIFGLLNFWVFRTPAKHHSDNRSMVERQ